MSSPKATTKLPDLEPLAVWRFFEGIAAVPRPSKQEERVRQHVCDIAKEHGLAFKVDGGGNVVIEVPASSGLERAPITVLQAHLDMVCEKNAATEHNFETDPIRLILDETGPEGEPIVRADGTTLGADNGIGVAMALAAACDSQVEHGPLELLFTVDEEAGMSGVKALTAASFRGRRLLNLDSEEDDTLYIGCAGGNDSVLTWNFKQTPVEPASQTFRVRVSGLRGGHSGGDIHENRGNAIKLLVRTMRLVDEGELRLVALRAGSVRNAIPREAEATILADGPAAQQLIKCAAQAADEAKRESAEPDVVICVEAQPGAQPDSPSGGALSAADTARLVRALDAIPNGVLGMHRQMPELVETSNNLATVHMRVTGDAAVVEACTLSRSSSAYRLNELCSRIRAIGQLSGAEVESANGYPGWSPNPKSPLVKICARIYADLFAGPPGVRAIHAGLECGLLAELAEGLDLVSLGPRIEGAHSPDERVYVSSVQKSWRLLVAILKELGHTDATAA